MKHLRKIYTVQPHSRVLHQLRESEQYYHIISHNITDSCCFALHFLVISFGGVARLEHGRTCYCTFGMLSFVPHHLPGALSTCKIADLAFSKSNSSFSFLIFNISRLYSAACILSCASCSAIFIWSFA